MPIISIAIQKGGSGKTTTTINLAAALQRSGKKVLLIDADPQANLSQSLGIEDEPEHNLYTELKKEMLGEESDISKAILEIRPGFSVIPASIELAGAEIELVGVYSREHILSALIEPIVADYDFIFIDCPHAIGMLTINALVASDYVLMPLQGEFLPLKGVHSFMRHYEIVRKKLNKKLSLLGFVLIKYDERKLMNTRVKDSLEKVFENKVFKSVIRTNIQLAKAQEAGTDIFLFDKYSNGATDYRNLAEEFLNRLELQDTFKENVQELEAVVS
ncbi:MAG: ParA family protein [Bacteroidetes bacterium]|nr:ParA family protein [Bacteroidota bacterium]